MMNENIPVIVGPTGVGKTAAAVTLAQENLFEIISADSRQVYRGMDVATGKEANQGEWQAVNGRRTLVINNVPIHGLDVVEPDQPFSVADWYKLVEKLVTEITQRNHQPLVVGGTGFYLDALAGRIATLDLPPADSLRQSLNGLPVEELQQRLMEVDPEKFSQLNDSDRRNPVRLIRAIEIAASGWGRTGVSSEGYNLRLIGLTMDRQRLLSRVDRRIDQMVEQGLVDETKRLVEKYGMDIPSMSGIGYREITRYLEGEIPMNEAVGLMKIRTHQYIKRQYTWFNHQLVEWVSVEEPQWMAKLAELVKGEPPLP